MTYTEDERTRIVAAAEPFGIAVTVHDTVASTQDVCRGRAAREPRPCVVASNQTHGRGTRGRTWDQTDGDISLSVAVRPGGVFPSLLLPLLFGKVVFETIEAETHADLRFKWPNDLLARGRKLAGILIESAGGDTWIAGAGINVNRESFPRGIVATSLRRLENRRFDRAGLVVALLGRIGRDLEAAARGDLRAIERGFERGLGIVGTRVRVTTPQGPHEGRLTAVTAAGVDLGGTRLALGEVLVLEPI